MNSNGSRPEDGEQLLHEGVLFLPPVAGGSHGRPPAECSLSAASCYVPIPPSRQAQDLYEEKRSHESLAETREKTRVKLELECAAAWRGGHYG